MASGGMSRLIPNANNNKGREERRGVSRREGGGQAHLFRVNNAFVIPQRKPAYSTKL